MLSVSLLLSPMDSEDVFESLCSCTCELEPWGR